MNIKVEPVLKSTNQFGNTLFTARITFPRIILAELNTHRMLSKNSASSRAIPAKKMQKSVADNGFEPLAWQQEHSGMQGTEYIVDIATLTYAKDQWNFLKKVALDVAERLTSNAITKQLTNRVLETFMYHTVLISGTEWDNFFELRCPRYYFEPDEIYLKSKKDWLKYYEDEFETKPMVDIDWRAINHGKAEIHMMELAEQLWDSYNETKAQTLLEGKWHIPYEVSIDGQDDDFTEFVQESEQSDGTYDEPYITQHKIKVSVGMHARTSYTVVGDEKEVKFETLLKIHDNMTVADPMHASPFEHTSRAMTKQEYYMYAKAYIIHKSKVTEEMKLEASKFDPSIRIVEDHINIAKDLVRVVEFGWCRNYRGFIQYRHLLETGQEIV